MDNNIKFINESLESDLIELFKNTSKELIVVCPWIKNYGAQLIIKHANPEIDFRIFTRMNLMDFAKGISDIEAYEVLFNTFTGMQVHCIKNLHAKLYISDKKKVILTSGNLTLGGIKNNIETGIYLDNSQLVSGLTESVLSKLGGSMVLHNTDFVKIVTEQKISRLKDLLSSKSISKKELQSININEINLGDRVSPTTASNDSIDSLENKLGIELMSELDEDKLTMDEIHGKEVQSKLLAVIPETSIINPRSLGLAFTPHLSISATKRNEIEELDRLMFLGRHVLTTYLYLDLYKNYEKIYTANYMNLAFQSIKARMIDGDLLKFLDTDDLLTINRTLNERELRRISSNSKLAFLGVLFLNFGFDKFLRFFDKYVRTDPSNEVAEILLLDSKSTIMELFQFYFKESVSYKELDRKGPDDNTIFKVGVYFRAKLLQIGEGSSLQQAEKDGARKLLLSEKVVKFFDKWVVRKRNTMIKKKKQFQYLSPKRDFLLRELSKALEIESSYLPSLNEALTTEIWCNDHNISTDFSYVHYYKHAGTLLELYLANKAFNLLEIPTSQIQSTIDGLKGIHEKLFDEWNLTNYIQDSQDLTDKLKQNFVKAVVYVKFISSSYINTVSLLDKYLSDYIEGSLKIFLDEFPDKKGLLQQYMQNLDPQLRPVYSMSSTGKDDSRMYKALVYMKDLLMGSGEGTSIKGAQEKAAENALSKLNIKNITQVTISK